MTGILLVTALFLLAGVVAVPLASRFKLGSVLGYIIAGIIISPLLALLKVDVITIQHFAEFGVVMMLFLVGLELEPKLLWRMKNKLLGLGGLQVLITVCLVALIAFLLGVSVNAAIAIGFIFSLSSTAIVLQTLGEQGKMKTEGGQSSFSVLLFQDIAVIPMLAIIPLLAISKSAEDAGHHGSSFSLIAGMPGWMAAITTFAVVLAVIVGGILLSRPVFRFAASAKLREILVGAALLWVLGIALLMSTVNLSPALGTFLAGVVLANSEFRHELESNIGPFKGLLLGLFFMTVGASVDFNLLGEKFFLVVGLTLGLMFIKAAVLFVLARVFNLQRSDKWLFTLGLAQAGEFAFVLLALVVTEGVIAKELASLLLLVVALSMLLTPACFLIQDRFLSSSEDKDKDREADQIDEKGSIIIAGHGRFGGIINRMVRGLGYQTTVLDYDYQQLEMLRKFEFEAYFGDATRPDLLHAAGIEHAKVLVVALDDKASITELVKYCVKNFLHVHVIARAIDRSHVYELYAVGCRDIIRETFDSAVRAGRSTLEALGQHPFQAERNAKRFVEVDQHSIRTLATLYKADVPIQDNPEYIKKAVEIRLEHEAQIKGEDPHYSSRSQLGWIPPTKNNVDV